MSQNPQLAPLENHHPRAAAGPAVPAARDCRPQATQAFGDYDLLEEIARGGMGIVYRAWQRSLNRTVAIKTLLLGPEAKPESIKRFQAEASLAASLQHPHIVGIHEVGVQEGRHYFVMDYLEGKTLAELVDRQPLPARRAASYLRSVAEAIQYAHERGILHRDLKPSNVLVDTHDHLRVTDFGLARRFEGESQVTLSGQLVGSPGYLPPEQAETHRGKVSRRSDVYGLGAILYHLLTGRPPFQAETITEALRQVLNVEPVPPRLLNPSVPRDLETICLKCLEKAPARRYGTAQMVADELDRFLSDRPILARPITGLGKAWRWCQRNPALASLIAALAFALCGGAAGVFAQLSRARAAEFAARRNAYVADMNLARQAVEESNLGRARALLERYRPSSGGKSADTPGSAVDPRGWVWRWLWQCTRTQERAVFSGDFNSVHSVAVSGDARWLAAMGSRDALRVWDLASQSCVAAQPTSCFYRNPIVCAPSGKSLFAGSFDSTSVQIWNLPNLEFVTELPHENPVHWITVSSDGQFLAAADAEQVKIWDIPALNQRASISPDRNLRYGRVALSHKGRQVAFSDYEGRIEVWDWVANTRQISLPGHGRAPVWQAAIQDLAFTPDGAGLLSAGSDRTLRLWQLRSGRELRRLSGHTEVVTALAFSPDGAALATASCDQTVRLWDVATWQPQTVLRGHLDEVWDVTFLPDGSTLASAGKDGTVRLWDAHPNAERQFMWQVAKDIQAIKIAADAGQFALVQTSGAMRLIDSTTWQDKLLRNVQIPLSEQFCIALNPKATCLVAATESGPLRTWSLPDGTEGEPFLGHTGRVQVLSFSPDGRWLASAGTDGSLRIWQTETRRQLARFPHEHEAVSSLALSANAQLLGVTFNDDELEVWESTTGRRSVRFCPHKSTHFVSLLRRPNRFVTGSGDGTTKVWDMRTLDCQSLMRSSLRGVTSLAVTPDDRTLATGTGEGMIRIWDLQLEQELAVLKGHREAVEQVAFSSDTRFLFSVSRDSVRVWYAPSWAEIERAEMR